MSKRAAEIVYSEFGLRAFLTRDIGADTMTRLGRTLKVSARDPIRKVKIGQRLSAMENRPYTLNSGVRVKMTVSRPNNDRRPRRFRLVDLAAPFSQTAGAPEPSPQVSSPPVLSPPAVVEAPPYDVLLMRAGVGYMAICPAFPGCYARGRSETETLTKLRETIARRRQEEARAAKLRMEATLNEYIIAGYTVRRTTVRAPEQPPPAAR